MLSTHRTIVLVTGLLAASLLSGCSDAADANSAVAAQQASQNPSPESRVVLDVYKGENCGCCGKWMEHLDTLGIDSVVHATAELDASNAKLIVPPAYGSCHTAVSKEGYVFVGHIPARYIKQFLTELPEGAVGLSVPGMPLGSPGMEQDGKFNPYDVLLLRADGSTEVYASVQTSEEQY